MVGIIDYGSGNFASVWNAFAREGVPLRAVEDPGNLSGCTHLVLPGVGAFSHAMNSLTRIGMVNPLQDVIADGRIPFLGICVGMQILAESGSEFEETRGMGCVSGRVERFNFDRCNETLPLPHIGWNEVDPDRNGILFDGISSEDSTFYFVHSYCLVSEDPGCFFTRSYYGNQFISAFEKDRLFGVQFHPEKSGANGKRLITNFLNVS